MILSKERLLREKQSTGYRQEIIEKVVYLIEVLNAIADDSYLSPRLALKGGTALNLFHFNLPRLSVDADLNYIGALDRNVMMEERPQIENRIKGLFERMGLRLMRHPKEHAGGKMVWSYPSAFGNQGNIEVDLNFMYRIPLLPTEYKDSILVAGRQVKNLQLLDIHEIAAGKLTALLERQTGRDFFDAKELFQYANIEIKKLRLAFVLYAAMCSKKDILKLTLNDIVVDTADLKNKLIPVMNANFYEGFSSSEDWTEDLVNKVRDSFKSLLPFTEKEEIFMRSVTRGEGIKPELLITDPNLTELIKKHPGLLWAAKSKIHS